MIERVVSKATRVPLPEIFFVGVGYGTAASYVLVSRSATWIIGDTPYANTTLLIAFLLGMSVGAAWGGRRPFGASRVAVACGVLALYTLSFPLLHSLFTSVYLATAPPIGDTSLVARNVARFLLGASVFAVPSILAGIAIPTLAGRFGWYAVGAAFAALTMPYALVLKLGVTGTVVLASVAFFGSRAADITSRPRPDDEAIPRAETKPIPWTLVVKLVIALAVAAVVVDLFSAQIDLFGSLLGFVLQNSVLVAFVSLAGLALAILARQGVLRNLSIGPIVALAYGFLAVSVVTQWTPLGLGLGVGALIARQSARSWIGYALALGGLSLLVTPANEVALLLPAMCLGIALPLIFHGAAVGQTSATILVGAALGALVGPQLILPWLGMLLLVAAGLTIYALTELGPRRAVAAFCVSGVLWVPFLPGRGTDATIELAQDSSARRRQVARLPILFTVGRERALAMGPGLAAQGFSEIVRAEPTSSQATAAPPNVKLFREDGRSVLLESPDRYDAILIDTVRSQEVFALASKRLRRNGVVLQSFQLREISVRNLFVIVNTVRSVFDHVSLWTHRDDGFVLASNEPLRLDLESIRPNPSALELLGDLVVTDDDIDRFLDSVSALVGIRRNAVSTDARPEIEGAGPTDLFYLQNRALFQRLRSVEPFPFRGEPTRAEEILAQGAFVRGWDDPRAIPRIARMWSEDPVLSGIASQWLYNELSQASVEELRSQLDAIAGLVARADSTTDCEPISHFMPRVKNLRLSVHAFSGESLDATDPSDAIDGIFDPDLGRGWRARPLGRAVTLDVRFDAPTPLASVHVIARADDDGVTRSSLYGLDDRGLWHPLASASDDCDGARRFRLRESAALWKGLRIELQHENDTSPIALHEVWAS